MSPLLLSLSMLPLRQCRFVFWVALVKPWLLYNDTLQLANVGMRLIISSTSSSKSLLRRLLIRFCKPNNPVVIYAPSADRGRSIIRVNGSAKKFVRITSGFGGGEGIRTTRPTANSPPR